MCQHLAVSRHRNLRPQTDGIFGLPQTRDSLCLRVKVETALAVEQVASTTGNRLLVSGEGGEGQWDWDRAVRSTCQYCNNSSMNREKW